MAEAAGYRFVSWVRSGLAALLTPTSVAAGPAGRPGLGVRVNVTRDHGPAFPVDRPIDLLGPGDVVGVDPRQVIRTDPHAGATDAEPNYLVQVELDRPDLPWLFSPVGVVGERISPWIVLVVVAVGPGVGLSQPKDAPLPILSLDADAEPGTQLPDLGESWAWAHGQALVLPGEEVDAVLTGVPARNAARLVSPRRLDPMTRYLACVVPAFEAGRRAGLGLPLAGPGVNPLAPAWNTTATAVALPVYYSFDFATGAGGDFESLAACLATASAARWSRRTTDLCRRRRCPVARARRVDGRRGGRPARCTRASRLDAGGVAGGDAAARARRAAIAARPAGAASRPARLDLDRRTVSAPPSCRRSTVSGQRPDQPCPPMTPSPRG